MSAGNRIRAARLAKHMTQKAVGEKCGIAEPTIRRYELGKLKPKKETLERITAAFDLPLSFFLATTPFEDLDFLDKFKAVILSSLEKRGLFNYAGRCLNDIGNYEYWKCIGDHILSIAHNEKNTLSIQYNDPNIPNIEKAKFVEMRIKDQFLKKLEELREREKPTPGQLTKFIIDNRSFIEFLHLVGINIDYNEESNELCAVWEGEVNPTSLTDLKSLQTSMADSAETWIQQNWFFDFWIPNEPIESQDIEDDK